jgi:hypothetical protein
VRPAIAILLCLLMVGESAGAARAFGIAATVHCCCGSHFGARRCKCPSCPAVKKKKSATTRVTSDCARGGDEGRLEIVAVPCAQPRLSVVVSEIEYRENLSRPRQLFGDAERPPP